MVQKILIVDDELDKKRKLYNLLYEASLSKNWYKLIFSTTGEEALEIIKKDKKQEISLIILDLRLDKGEINGVDFANTLPEFLTKSAIAKHRTRISHKICDRQTQKPYRKWV